MKPELYPDPRDPAVTLLTTEEARGLLPAYITSRHELNAAELENILFGQRWALACKRDMLSEKFVKQLHRMMFCHVWRWAGAYRHSDRNIGIPFWEVPVAVRQLLEDVKAWIEFKSYPADEIAVRLHHRLVQIHPFPNGNGRHSRLIADLLVMRLGKVRFTWGRTTLEDAGSTRRQYIAALQSADRHDIRQLLTFARD